MRFSPLIPRLSRSLFFALCCAVAMGLPAGASANGGNLNPSWEIDTKGTMEGIAVGTAGIVFTAAPLALMVSTAMVGPERGRTSTILSGFTLGTGLAATALGGLLLWNGDEIAGVPLGVFPLGVGAIAALHGAASLFAVSEPSERNPGTGFSLLAGPGAGLLQYRGRY